MQGFEIQKAERGGYFVQPASPPNDHGIYRGIVFAGALDECLDFIQREFEKEGEAK